MWGDYSISTDQLCSEKGALRWDPWADPSFRGFLSAIQSYMNFLCVSVSICAFFSEKRVCGFHQISDRVRSLEWRGLDYIPWFLPLLPAGLGESFGLCLHLQKGEIRALLSEGCSK